MNKFEGGMAIISRGCSLARRFSIKCASVIGHPFIFLSDISRDCIWNKYFLTRSLISDIEADRSEFDDEPGTIRLFE